MKLLRIIILFFCVALLASCSMERKKVVAVSQCSMDEWRDQMNEEMRREAFLHTDLDVEYHSTADNSEDQIKDIESFIERKVDLIVVAPNEEEALRPVIEKAYDAGIPVVLIDRKANTEKYTAYVGGDNVEVGRQAAYYIIDKLPNGGNIIELEGLASSSASQERYDGFHEVMDRHPEIRIVGHAVADWQRQKAYQAMDTLGARLGDTPVDIVFAYNDRMAIGAHDSFVKNKGKINFPTPLFIGVDALMNDSIGVGRIEDGTLEATFLYPTGGDKAIHTAACILNGVPYQREQIMQTCIVNQGNVHLMRLQAEHIGLQDKKIEFLNTKLDDFFKQYSAQRVLLITFIVLVIVVCALLAVSIRGYNTKRKLNVKLAHQKDILQKQRDELAEQKETLERQRDMLEEERDKLIEASLAKAPQVEPAAIAEAKEPIAAPASPESASASAPAEVAINDEDPFLKKLMLVIEKNLDNSDLTVDMIGAEVNLGRVQLYRKCKALSGMSPNELLRTARLNKSYQLLRDTDMTVSEVAYSVGFSSPSYFAKCYKDHFGKTPSNN